MAFRFFRKTVWVLLGALAATPAAAQQPLSNLRTTLVDARQPLQRLDSSTVAAPLLEVRDSASGQVLDLAFFSLENNDLRIDTARLAAAAPGAARLFVRYRVLPRNLAAPFSRLDPAAIRRAAGDDAIEFDYTPYEPPSKPWDNAGLRSNGSYTRGLSFGNSQNLAFNSNLNLQLDGQLGNDLEVSAALSDNSIPLQADGTTRQLQEFDRIFIQIKRKNAALSAGDYDLTRPAGYFSNYFKRLQGAMLTLQPAGKQPLYVRAAAAVSKGKFARQSIAGQEGNQGPYRLLGAEGERFIIVLAGTEKVFVDGQQLQRGLTDDYTIDYNLGELTFTPRRLISKDSRIIVEFEYAVQTYLRSTFAANVARQGTKHRFFLNAYAEQDGKHAGGAQDLSAAERRRLAEVGDDLANAYASGIDTLPEGTPFDPGRVLYRAVDTLACGLPVTVLVQATDAETARYAARFSEVPAGQGNYVLAQTSANGRVFRWVAPDPVTCQPTGNFEPVVRLVAPESRQLFSAGADLNFSKKTALQAEIALSNRDLNRFSPLGNADNAGVAGVFSLRQNLLGAAADSGWTLSALVNYEFAGRQFLPLNPYRPAEFGRDWNVGAAQTPADEHWARGGLNLQKTGWGSARYEFGAFLRGDAYDGKRHLGQARFLRDGYDVSLEFNLLETAGAAGRTRFSRPKFDAGKTFFSRNKKALFKLGFYGERERNERFASGADTLAANSFWYDLGRLYLQTPEGQGAWQFGASWMHRADFAPAAQTFAQSTAVDEANLNGRWNPPPAPKGGTQTLSWNFSWRQLRVLDPARTTLSPQQTYLGRLDYSRTAWRGALAFTAGYELGSGQSPKIEFNYVRVNPGEGQYTWVDRNRDSLLQVDEMEVAVFQDQANYVRVAVTTPDYVRTNNANFNQSLRLDPRLVWAQSKKRWQRTLARWSVQSNVQISRRVLASARDEPAWNPFDLGVSDTALVAVSSVLRNVLFLNRADPAWDASLAQSDNRGRTALSTGFESRRLADWTLHGRVNFRRTWSAELDLVRCEKENDSEVFNTRDYRVLFWRATPKLSWLPLRSFRAVASYVWQNSENTLSGAETARQTNWSAELTWNPESRPVDGGFRPVTSLRARATLAQVRYTGAANSAIAYAMLEGLQDGRNLLWNLSLDRQLSRSVQLSLSYEGRKTGETRTVHVGRAQVRAVF